MCCGSWQQTNSPEASAAPHAFFPCRGPGVKAISLSLEPRNIFFGSLRWERLGGLLSGQLRACSLTPLRLLVACVALRLIPQPACQPPNSQTTDGFWISWCSFGQFLVAKVASWDWWASPPLGSPGSRNTRLGPRSRVPRHLPLGRKGQLPVVSSQSLAQEGM